MASEILRLNHALAVVDRRRPSTGAGRSPAAESGLSIEVVTEAEAFLALREEWNALLAGSAAETIFLAWEWLYTWWKHLGHHGLSILAVRRGSELIAVAPLALRRGLGPLRPPRLEFLGSGIVGSDYLDVIAKRGSEREALDVLAGHLEQRGAALDLHAVRSEGGLAERLAAALEGRKWRALRERTETCPFIPLAGRSWEAYLAGLGPAHRYNFKRRLRRLREAFDLRFERIETEERRREAMAILFHLHEKRWRERGGSTAFVCREVLAFHEEVSRLALERGWLRLFILWLTGQPVAGLYGFRYRGTFSFYQSGFDTRFARWSVGLVTVGLAIKSAVEEGVEEFDFLHGGEAYKFLWVRDARDLARVEIDPPSRAALLHRRAIRAERAVRRLARRLLPTPLAERLAAWSA